MHDFSQSKRNGLTGEAILDAAIGATFPVSICGPGQRVTRAVEKDFGIDRCMVLADGRRYAVEYKTDTRMAETGNAAIETWHNFEKGERGWAYTTLADYVLYLSDGDRIVYVIDVLGLKRDLPSLSRMCDELSVRSGGEFDAWTTKFLKVPREDLRERLCVGEYRVDWSGAGSGLAASFTTADGGRPRLWVTSE